MDSSRAYRPAVYWSEVGQRRSSLSTNAAEADITKTTCCHSRAHRPGSKWLGWREGGGRWWWLKRKRRFELAFYISPKLKTYRHKHKHKHKHISLKLIKHNPSKRIKFVCQTHPNRLADRTAMNPSYVPVTAKQLGLNPRDCGYDGADRETKFNVSASGRRLE